MDESWTIAELAELAAEALARPGTVGPAGSNGRVRDVPNERLIRWYATVGLVDPPLSRKGRIARYGRRHLLQLVAVKRRQAEGKSLAEIQAELAGATDENLATVAQVPALRPALAQGGGPDPVTGAGPGRFWARQPRQPVAEASTAVAKAPTPVAEASTAGTDSGGAGVSPAVPLAGLVHGIRLAPGVTLLLDGAGREPSPEDITGILTAARPLLIELASRGLGASGAHHSAEMDQPRTGAGNEH